jgi:acetolactate synthase-1/2/3 large subunit
MQDKIKVSDLIAKKLEDLEIKHIFGIIGAGNVHLFESIGKRGYTEIICVHHEQAACMAVQTYYRLNGRISAALLTTGAGSTNGITGVMSAWADSIPCLIIAGNENSKFTYPENPLRMWGVQGYDSVAMVEKITKYSHRVMKSENVFSELSKAVFVAKEGRPGPVWIEIPMDIQSSVLSESAMELFVEPESAQLSNHTLDTQIVNVVEALSNAKRPLIWLGNGIRLAGAETEIPQFLEMINTPALVSWAGIDMVDSSHPLVFGSAGVYGQRAANFILQNCDYLLTIGTRMAIPQIGYDLNELARAAKIDVVDIDPHEATKHKTRINQSIVSDAGLFISKLMKAAGSLKSKSNAVWIDQCNSYLNQFPWVDEQEHQDRDGFINSYKFMKHLNKMFKDDQIVVTDMGTALLCGHQVLEFKTGQRLMTSTGLGEMGYGLPAAIGVSFANNKGEVICLNCDGGMMMNLQELQTVVHHNLPIKLFIFNNDGYLMIKHTQRSLFKSGYVGTDTSSGVSCPDFSRLATAFNIPAYQIRTWQECDETIEKVLAHTGPVICEVFMHPEQPFTPKLSVVIQSDGKLVSPPLEDLSPLITRENLEKQMTVGMHEKSRNL